MNRIQKVFLITFAIFAGYHLLAHVPFWPEDIMGFDPKKILKIIAGVIFIVLIFKTMGTSKES